jgi:hypothetical protein
LKARAQGGNQDLFPQALVRPFHCPHPARHDKPRKWQSMAPRRQWLDSSPRLFVLKTRSRAVAVAALGAPIAAFTAGSDANTEEAAYLSVNGKTVAKMMDEISTIKPIGDVDRDFVALMLPHHQRAIDMAQAELHYCHYELLRLVAQEIVVEQQQEIIAMIHALGQPLPPTTPASDESPAPNSTATPGEPISHNSMQMNMHKEPR